MKLPPHWSYLRIFSGPFLGIAVVVAKLFLVIHFLMFTAFILILRARTQTVGGAS